MYHISSILLIIPQGLKHFPEDLYEIKPSEWDAFNAHAILLRSHKLHESEIDVSVRAIARCGAGVNNVPVARMTEVGIPVFNTPGANANAVKELIICGMLLGSRRIVDGINHMKELGEKGQARERVEKDKVRNILIYAYYTLLLQILTTVNDISCCSHVKGNVWWT